MSSQHRSPLDRLIAAEREHGPSPAPETAAQGWDRLRRALPGAVIVPEFDVAPSSLGGAGASKATAAAQLVGGAKATAWKLVGWGGWMGKTIVGATVATVVTAGVLASRSDDGRGTPAAARSDAATAGAVDPLAAPPVVAPSVAEPPQAAIEPALLPDATPTLASETPPATAAATPPTRRPRALAPRESTAAPPAATLDDEAALLRAANRALGAGDAALALARLSEHASRFEHGALAQDRDALRVIVLCRAGRRSDAAAARQRFLERWPSSVHAARVRAACPDAQP